MTPSEFKAWFDGFTEALTGVPTKAQWARIKERVSEIDGKAVTERIYVDRYWHDWWHRYPFYASYTSGAASSGSPTFTTCSNTTIGGCNSSEFNSLSAMNALGKADALVLSR